MPQRPLTDDRAPARPTAGSPFEPTTDPAFPDSSDRWNGASPPLPVAYQLWMFRLTFLLLSVLMLVGNVIHLAVVRSEGTPDPVFAKPAWNGDGDGSHIEMLGHIQLVAAAVILVFLCIGRRVMVYGAWAAIVIALVIDDLFQVHERVGADLVTTFDLPALIGLRAQDLGELLTWAGLAGILGVLLLVAHLRAPLPDRRNSLLLAVLTVFLAVFAVGVDQAHVIIQPHVPLWIDTALTLTETAGELLGMTLILIAVHTMAVRPRGRTTHG
ncbi:hypothetical protein [Planctomonas psychrotolerans]|uniref:hypothetical protein n=1 Tax=Planctomonas psychrotolerans TaxID=2528712 RepID=UPI0012392D10|nr:hypothetical protein [Planctomonas psychrotolerans]